MDYISREEILAEYDRQHKGPAGGARKIMETWPAADVVPVVRCKDCLYGSENGFICGNVHGLQYAFPNAFCSNGTARK